LSSLRASRHDAKESPMMKHGKAMSMLALGAALTGSTFEGALGQNQTPPPDGYQAGNLLNRPYLTSTGQVVPKPGDSQAGPQTAPDRKAQQQDDAIVHSICSNC
jgi:hypothetical protein